MVTWNTDLLQYNHPLHEYIAKMAPDEEKVEFAVAAFLAGKPSERLAVRTQRTDLGTRIEWEVWAGSEHIGTYATETEADDACSEAQPTCEYCDDFAARTDGLA